MTTTRIKKWGNSYGLRIQKSILDDLNILPDSPVDVHQEDGRIIITPIHVRDKDLNDLLAKITPENQHQPADWGDTSGNEVW